MLIQLCPLPFHVQVFSPIIRSLPLFKNNFVYLFVYGCLGSSALHRLPLVAVSRGHFLFWCWPLTAVASLVAEHGLQVPGRQEFSTRAQYSKLECGAETLMLSDPNVCTDKTLAKQICPSPAPATPGAVLEKQGRGWAKEGAKLPKGLREIKRLSQGRFERKSINNNTQLVIASTLTGLLSWPGV